MAGAAWAAMYSVEVDADARGVGGGGGVLGGRRRAASARCGSSREVVVVVFSSFSSRSHSPRSKSAVEVRGRSPRYQTWVSDQKTWVSNLSIRVHYGLLSHTCPRHMSRGGMCNPGSRSQPTGATRTCKDPLRSPSRRMRKGPPRSLRTSSGSRWGMCSPGSRSLATLDIRMSS